MRAILKALFGLTLLALLLWRLDLHAVVSALSRFTWPWLLGALALMTASWNLAALRWKLFAPRFSFMRLLELTLIGQFFAIVLPGQLAGELVKAYRLAKGNVDAERLAASVMVDRIVGTIALLLVASFGAMHSSHALPGALVWTFAGMTAILIASLFTLRLPAFRLIAIDLVGRLERTRLRRAAIPLHRAIEAWVDFGGAPGRLLASLFVGVVFQLVGVAILAVLATNLGIILPAADWAWIYGLVSLAVLIPISIGGIGLREGALVGCLDWLGIDGAHAIALSLGVFAVTLGGALFGGALELGESLRAHRVAHVGKSGPNTDPDDPTNPLRSQPTIHREARPRT